MTDTDIDQAIATIAKGDHLKVLGIANGPNASACLAIGPTVVAAAAEERFSRVKMDDTWPKRSISYVLTEAGLSLDQLDAVAYGWSAGFDEARDFLSYFDRIVHECRHDPEGLPILRERIQVEYERDAIRRNEFHAFARTLPPHLKVLSFDHHDAHAFSASMCSPFPRGLILTGDARGDYVSFMASQFNGADYSSLYRASSADSIGFFYGRITGLLGFKPLRHEGKVTGLAAHGDPQKLLPLMEKMISVRNGEFKGHLGPLFRPFFSNYDEALLKALERHSREDIAAAAQAHLENCVVTVARHYLEQSGETNLCLAGGIFGNVLLNQKLRELPGVTAVYVQPEMSDSGLSLGACAAALRTSGQYKIEYPHVYLGPGFSDTEIEAELSGHSLQWKRCENLVCAAFEAIRDNKVVGWFQGRMEWGPRALCHRSVLYHCRDHSVNDWLNKRMHRTEFMPFAPVTAAEQAAACYLRWQPDHQPARFMTTTYDCTEEMKQKCPAAVHVDGTARPQVVFPEDNPEIHQLLTLWYEKTGEPALINTSFNMHEEPIVCHPREGIQGLLDGIVDILLIGSFVATRK